MAPDYNDIWEQKLAKVPKKSFELGRMPACVKYRAWRQVQLQTVEWEFQSGWCVCNLKLSQDITKIFINWVCLKIVYPYTQWLMIIVPMAIIGGIHHFQTSSTISRHTKLPACWPKQVRLHLVWWCGQTSRLRWPHTHPVLPPALGTRPTRPTQHVQNTSSRRLASPSNTRILAPASSSGLKKCANIIIIL